VIDNNQIDDNINYIQLRRKIMGMFLFMVWFVSLFFTSIPSGFIFVIWLLYVLFF